MDRRYGLPRSVAGWIVAGPDGITGTLDAGSRHGIRAEEYGVCVAGPGEAANSPGYRDCLEYRKEPRP